MKQEKLEKLEKQPLDSYYDAIKKLILDKQNPITGLLPASTAINSHGNYTDAWTRDNIYSILVVWGLAIAYEKEDHVYYQNLKYSVIKCMRGLLTSMMKQSPKVEAFKKTQRIEDALHAKYNTNTGDTVVGDHQWGHLQIDATSLFLLILAQMTTSGYQIVYSVDEVDFVQNLVYYIERAYRTPDYGIWERGNKMNHGLAELNSSSIGMACAALQAINNVNLFGASGGVDSIIHCLPDEITRNVIILHTALPRESNSKEVDAALLSVIGFPAFAVQDVALITKTRNDIINKLQGTYGMKRFLRDGHQCELEDTSRLHYEPHELQIFESIESEWPLFFTYLILDGLFYKNKATTKEYLFKMNKCLVHSDQYDYPLVPELFYVPKSLVDNEKQHPHSQIRQPNENIPLVWAQSLYMLGNLINDDHITINDMDPLGRRFLPNQHKHAIVVQLAFISEDTALQSQLNTLGLQTDVIDQLNLKVCDPKSLKQAYASLGQNSKLKLTGRPNRPMGILSTSRLYRIKGQLYCFTPNFMDREEFYLTNDVQFLVNIFENELLFINKHWTFTGRPTIVVHLTHSMMKQQQPMMQWFSKVNSGHINGVRVHCGRLSELVSTSCTTSLDFFNDLLPTMNDHLSNKLNFSTTDLKKETAQEAAKRTHFKRKSGTTLAQLGHASHTSPQFQTLDQLNPLVSGSQPLFFTDLNHSPPKPPSISLNFEMGNPQFSKEAVQFLLICDNLYDQLDILQYLHSCFGLHYLINDLNATISELLQEIYVKAMNFRLWNIVRTCAGLLCKMVNSLTINITDCLIRQKQLMIGQTRIVAPLPPQALMQLLYSQLEDVRLGPLLQEIITSLGTLIRSQPDYFKGILRLKLFYLIYAMQQQLQLTKQITTDEAMEALMQQSPYQTHCLLQQLFQTDSMEWHLKRRNDGALNRVPILFYSKVYSLLTKCKGFKWQQHELLRYPTISEKTAEELNFAVQVEDFMDLVVDLVVIFIVKNWKWIKKKQ